jgi:hypothetical protein
MAKTDFKTIDEYHATFEGENLARMQQIRDLIQRVVPEVEETIRITASIATSGI